MKDWISVFADNAVIAIDAMAVLIIAIGTIEMFVTCIRSVFAPSRTGRDLRDGYLRYARWLMAGLTFQLANDIIISARAPTWDDIGRLAADRVHPDVPQLLPRARHRGSGQVSRGRRTRSSAQSDVMPRR